MSFIEHKRKHYEKCLFFAIQVNGVHCDVVLDPIDFYYILFKISSFVFYKSKQVIPVWNAIKGDYTT